MAGIPRVFENIFFHVTFIILIVIELCSAGLVEKINCESENELKSAGGKVVGNLKYLRTEVSPEIQQQAVQSALERILGSRSNEILLKVDPSLTVTSEFVDEFRVGSVSYDDSGLIVITGTSGVATLYGVSDYLQNHCSSLIVWEGSQLTLPVPLPRVTYQKIILDKFRYFQNVCTDSYSFVWWDWDRWEKEIDWMALHGINMPLAFTGQEEIWRRVYLKLGLSEEDVRDYISGPAFLAWWRMGNIQKWGGPIPNPFLHRKLELLHKILDRMRNMGMIPVLPAFAGNVPATIAKIFPNVSLIEHPSWNHFNKSYSTFMLPPTDPLFKRIGKLFLTELTNEVGTDHIYSCDTFNENNPSENSTKFLKKSAQMTYSAMKSVDSKAVWMMQSWVFYSEFWKNEQVAAYLSGVDHGNALILDLEADRRPLYGKLHNFYGHSFIWCMLQNYGGTMNLYGAFDLVNNGIHSVRSNVTSNQFVGVGSCPEGINQNSVIFEFVHGISLQIGEVNITEWVNKYSDKRYGVVNDHLHSAWTLLRNGVYKAPKEVDNHGYSVATKRPSLTLSEKFWYNPEDMRRVFEYFLLALNTSTVLNASQLYKHDLVDFTRQFLVLLIAMNYQGLMGSFKKQRLDKFDYHAASILRIFDDLETILATNQKFLLGPWVKASESWGESKKDKANLRYNALNQITLWGPSGEISDYAAKQWSGSMEFYYKPRWQSFINALNTSLHTGEPFNSKRFRKHVLKHVEIPFTFSNQTFAITPKGDSILEAKRIYKHWNKHFSRLNKKLQKLRKHV